MTHRDAWTAALLRVLARRVRVAAVALHVAIGEGPGGCKDEAPHVAVGTIASPGWSRMGRTWREQDRNMMKHA